MYACVEINVKCFCVITWLKTATLDKFEIWFC